jgi:hypothetical protein
MVANPNARGIGQAAPSDVSGVAPKTAPIITPATTDPRNTAFALRYVFST